MEFTIKTSLLQSLVAKAVKGASNNKMIPITSFLNISLSGNELTLTTTDATNTLQVVEPKVEGEDFYITVVADTFSKLVQKTSSPEIKLALPEGENYLEFVGNGKYSIDLPVDEEGELVKFPTVQFKKTAKVHKVKLAVLKSIIRTNKAALADTMDIPMLTGYFIDETGVYTTNQFKVSANKVNLLPEPVLIPEDFMELVMLMDDEEVKIQIDGNKLKFSTKTVTVFGHTLEGVEDYPIDALNKLVTLDFGSKCTVVRQTLLDVIDRLSLFISPYDKNTVYLTFAKDGLNITSKRSNGVEKLSYQESTHFKPFTCAADIELLKEQLQVQEGEAVTLWYGQDVAIKSTFDNVTQIIALLEDERALSSDDDE